MKPMLKYRGGKSREIPFFEKYIPQHYDVYYEPFLGGGAVYFYLEPSMAVLNDVNARVMRFYQEVRDDYPEVRRQSDALQALYEKNQHDYEILKKAHPDVRVDNANEDLYYSLRDMYNHKIPSDYLESVLYFAINKTAYSGMIRYNSQGEYNVPFGRYRNFNTQIISPEHHSLLQGADLKCGDYSALFEMASEDDFMFLDPPYDCIFNDYGNISMENGFDESEHRRLAAAYRQLKCKALMVIGKTDLTEEIYGDLVIGEYDKKYAVNIRNRFKSSAKHIIVANYLL